jgi:hypothetical protein
MFGGGIAASGQLHPAPTAPPSSTRPSRAELAQQQGAKFNRVNFAKCVCFFFLMLPLTFSVLFQYNEMPRC